MQKERYASLDVFRGATVALMILVNNPGSWDYVFAPLDHSPWVGCTPTDLVFPFFLFAVGNAMAFVIPSFKTKPHSFFWKKIIKRSVLIFLIGLTLNWMPFLWWQNNVLVFKPWDYVRVLGVLQRIAICYALASVIIFYASKRWIYIISICILVGYWILCYIMNPQDPYSIAGWFGTYYDKMILGASHMYHGEGIAFDPEGFMSTPAAVVQVIIGYLIGQYIRDKGKNIDMLAHLFFVGLLLFLGGYFLGQGFPIIKKIWTSSYTIYTSGLATLVLSSMVYLIEFKPKPRRWAYFCTCFGKNALFVYILAGILPRVLWIIRIPSGVKEIGVSYLNPLSWFYTFVCAPLFPNAPKLGSLLYAIFFVCFFYIFVYLLNRKKIYIKV